MKNLNLALPKLIDRALPLNLKGGIDEKGTSN